MLGLESRKRIVNLFYMKVKRPDIKSCHQKEDDYTKLLKQMKDSIDLQVTLGMSKPVSVGILCEDFSCFLYRMRLLQDGAYVSVCLRKFLLVEDMIMIVNVTAAFEALWFVKPSLCSLQEELSSFQERYRARSRKHNAEEQAW
ncbi:hypothetical protein MBANPS3_011956, partial [Mucor bainieri]